MTNSELIEKYPWLQVEDFNYCWLDDLEPGWRKAFGDQMCEEIDKALIEDGVRDIYEISQIKEKYGFLHWYDNNVSDRVNRLIFDKYEPLSERTCGCCGAPAKYTGTGWIYPYCENCLPENIKKAGLYKLIKNE